ncbi:putative primosomal protein N' [Actinorhabdospora filicis]|uniref:Probable replication restart protein PriA n=1 Tax=Actinorhabdospora filicis TaxID=1785913 RepID=A0A9W6SH16_9ACTN|nr:putative primosomal protein N' [Actinorhabdospora filicis]
MTGGTLVARVCVDSPLPHLDRLFDYRVPPELAGHVAVGCRVKVRFSGQSLTGFIIELATGTDFGGRLADLAKVVSPEPVLTGEIRELSRAVADRYAGNLADVLRLAVPPRQARVEAEPPREPAGAIAAPSAEGWREYEPGDAFLTSLAHGHAPRAVWGAMPGEDWPRRLAEAAAATAAGERGSVLVVPDQRDLDRLDAALTEVLGPDRHVVLSAAMGPSKRYRAFLAAARGAVRVVAGTRAAMFAPVADLGLVAMWDAGDDSHAEPRAPYPHARTVLLTRAQQSGTAVLLGGFTRTTDDQLLLDTGWARELAAPRERLRERAPHIVPVGDDDQLAKDPQAAAARLPTVTWTAAKEALAAGLPVLVQTPRRGYIPVVSCQRCRARARCPHCAGPLSLPSAKADPVCRWCGRSAHDYSCPSCGGHRLRAAVIGAARTADELGRAFPEVPVRTSGGDRVLDAVPAGPALVVATPGAEPVAEEGYGAVLLLDAWALLTRADLRAGEETLRRWMTAAALARPARDGGRVVVVADGGLAVVQALLRWDAGWFAARELAERASLRFPPIARMASLTGPPEALADLLRYAELPPGTEELGPVPVDERTERLLLRAPRTKGAELASALHGAAGVRSARKAVDPVRVQVDPAELL